MSAYHPKGGLPNSNPAEIAVNDTTQPISFARASGFNGAEKSALHNIVLLLKNEKPIELNQ